MEHHVHRFATLLDAESIWRRLQGGPATHPFQTWEWLSAWHATVGQARQVEPTVVLVAGPERVPWMLFPLGIERRPTARVLVWLGGELSDYLGPLIAPECPDVALARFPTLWSGIVSALPRYSYAHLERQPARISGRDNPMMLLGVRDNPSQSHQALLGTEWEAWYRSRVSGKGRQTDRRKERKLEEHGAIALEVADDIDSRQALLPVLLAQKSRGYQELGVTDLCADEAHRAFLHRVTFETDLCHLSGLRVGSQLAATHWGLLYGGRLYYLLPAYDRGDLAARSPGALLCQRLLQWGIQNGVHTFDFTVGDEPYKARWCEVTTPLYDGLHARTLWGRVCTLVLDSRRAAKRRIKASRLFPWLLKVRARLRGGGAPGEPPPEL